MTETLYQHAGDDERLHHLTHVHRHLRITDEERDWAKTDADLYPSQPSRIGTGPSEDLI